MDISIEIVIMILDFWMTDLPQNRIENKIIKNGIYWLYYNNQENYDVQKNKDITFELL